MQNTQSQVFTNGPHQYITEEKLGTGSEGEAFKVKYKYHIANQEGEFKKNFNVE